MTAEIAILNKSAVALAADSKVTITTASGRKTYDTVNKLFTLSKYHPVGIMIYGNAEFMKYPWETIIKLYRQKKRNYNESRVELWALDFIEFLKTFGTIDEAAINRNISSVLRSNFERLKEDINKAAQEVGVTEGSADYVEIMKNAVHFYREDVKDKPVKFDVNYLRDISDNHGDTIVNIISEYFPRKQRKLTKDATHLEISFLMLDVYSPDYSGFVIAGFGSEEIFPTMVDYKTDGYIGKEIKYSKGDPVDIARDMPAGIAPFAQREMVDRFMVGIDPSYSLFLQGAFNSALQSTCMAIFEKYASSESKTKSIRRDISRAVQKRAHQLFEKSRLYRKDRYSDPIINMVSLLPKDELAHLAESLVALTSLRRKVSSSVETVGGPIDVAVISKSDGFIWIKRKHYFKPELNPHFQHLYMLSALNEVNTAVAESENSEDAEGSP